MQSCAAASIADGALFSKRLASKTVCMRPKHSGNGWFTVVLRIDCALRILKTYINMNPVTNRELQPIYLGRLMDWRHAPEYLPKRIPIQGYMSAKDT